MMLLKFDLGGIAHGLDIEPILEVIPSIELDPLEECPDGIVGVVGYRGDRVPVLDVELLTQGVSAKESLSTRIIVAELEGKKVAIRAEGVIDIVDTENDILALKHVSINDYWTPSVLSAF